MPKFDAAPLLDRIKVLSSDEFEGRRPGTKGEDLTVKYLEDAFRSLGLKPGNTDGSYIQKVPMVGITATNTTPLTISKGRDQTHVQVERRRGGVDEARGGWRVHRRFGHRLRRLRRDRARVQLGRFQGR